jgi:hypothetical protein
MPAVRRLEIAITSFTKKIMVSPVSAINSRKKNAQTKQRYAQAYTPNQSLAKKR